MANGIYSFDLGGFRPYAGLGLGLAKHTAEIDTAIDVGGTGEASVFAYQVLAGVGYPLSDRAEVLLGYRYFGTAEGDYGRAFQWSPAFRIGVPASEPPGWIRVRTTISRSGCCTASEPLGLDGAPFDTPPPGATQGEDGGVADKYPSSRAGARSRRQRRISRPCPRLTKRRSKAARWSMSAG